MANTLTPYLKLRVDEGLTDDAAYNLNRLDLLGQSVDITGSSSQAYRAVGDIFMEPDSPAVGGTGTGGRVWFGDADHTLTALEVYATAFNVTGTISATNLILGGDTVATLAASQIFTNKTIDADSNTISNIRNGNVASDASIEFTKLEALTASRVLVSNGTGELTVSSITSSELGYLTGTTSAIQTQLDGKETDLGNPALDGYILSSTAAGARSWIESPALSAQSKTFTWTSGTTKVAIHSFATNNVDVSVYDVDGECFVTVEKVEILDTNTIQLTSLDAPPSGGYRIYVRTTSA